jgi:methyl-accepting chemotaxis protein
VVLLVVPLTLANSRSITGRSRGADLAKAIAQADLTQRGECAGQRRDRRAAASARSHAQLSLCTLVGQVRQASDSMSVSSGEVASGNLDLSQRTEQTASTCSRRPARSSS